MGGRGERPKYFPPLGHFFGAKESSVTTENPTSKRARNLGAKSEKRNQTRMDSRNSSKTLLDFEETDWVPIFNSSSSRNGTGEDEKPWFNEGGASWTPQVEDVNAGPETKIENWLPEKRGIAKIGECRDCF